MSDKPKALELAEKFDWYSGPEWKQAAAMLREQHAEIERLKTAKVEPSDAHPYGDGKRPFGWDPMAHE